MTNSTTKALRAVFRTAKLASDGRYYFTGTQHYTSIMDEAVRQELIRPLRRSRYYLTPKGNRFRVTAVAEGERRDAKPAGSQSPSRMFKADAQGATDFDFGYTGPARLKIGEDEYDYDLTKAEELRYEAARDGRARLWRLK